ncbi:MAG: YggS family pyridoxal phosphate-dependent enzyme [Candidatus Sericytochromatia bacterium]|nr:YggS family pyridoxal phosphate-dependent enzyme [Candidatus Sericytochromatia bacterium]
MDDISLNQRIRHLVAQVRHAAERGGRSPDAVRIVAVTKYSPVDILREAQALGLTDFGESKVQDAVPKQRALAAHSLRWHLVGHLQTNKVKLVVGNFSLVHSVDSWRLAEALSHEALVRGLVQPVLFQVNVSGEPSKYGFPPQEAPAVAERAFERLPGLEVQGFMTMAPQAADAELARPWFQSLKGLFDRVACHGPSHFQHLSMGMSQDYRVAIEEGATLIRVGSALFRGEAAQRGTMNQ